MPNFRGRVQSRNRRGYCRGVCTTLATCPCDRDTPGRLISGMSKSCTLLDLAAMEMYGLPLAIAFHEYLRHAIAAAHVMALACALNVSSTCGHGGISKDLDLGVFHLDGLIFQAAAFYCIQILRLVHDPAVRVYAHIIIRCGRFQCGFISFNRGLSAFIQQSLDLLLGA